MKLTCLAAAFVLVFVALNATSAHAQSAALTLTAKSANVADPGTPIKISVLKWSTDQERKPIAEALDPVAQAEAQAAAAAGRGGRGNRGGGGGGGGRGARAGLDPDDPAMADVDAQPARGGRGGGRGGRGGDAAAPKPADPIATLAEAISKAPTVGYLWTNETVGYSIKYAYRIPSSDGGERIILATDRRLGAGTVGWKPAAAMGTPTDYQFTVIEVRLDAKGSGEAKATLASKVVFDSQAKTPAVENYATTLPIFQNVKK